MKNKSYSKMVAIFALVLAMVTSLSFALPAALCYAQGGYAIVSAAGIPHPGFTSLTGKINTEGVLTDNVVAKSSDKLCQLTLNKDTEALNKWGRRLTSVIVVEMKKPPAPPPDANVVGLIYDLSPDRATFNPPISLTFTYDPDLIPEGVAEGNLMIARWVEESAGKWVNLASTVDLATDTITARISHFTAFTIVAYTRPAAFTASALTISPAKVDIGETVTISAKVANTGDLAGTYKVTLKIDDEVVATEDATLAGGASQKVTFTTAKDVAGTYTVNVEGLSGSFTVKVPPAPPLPVKWWLIGGIIAACIIIGLVVWQVVVRRRAY